MTRDNIPNGREWFTPYEAATYCGTDRHAIVNAVKAGTLPGYYRTQRDGKQTKNLAISRADLDAFMTRYPVMNPRDVMHAVGVLMIMAVGMAWPMIEGLAW